MWPANLVDNILLQRELPCQPPIGPRFEPPHATTLCSFSEVEASFIVDDEILVRSSDKTVLGVIRESGNVVAVIRVKDSRVGVDVEAYLGNEISIIRDKGPRPWPDWLVTTRWRWKYT